MKANSFFLPAFLMLGLLLMVNSQVLGQRPLGKKLNENSIEIDGYSLNIGDTLQLGKGSYYTGDFLYIYARIGNKPSPLGASMIKEKVVIDHFRYVKNKYGEQYLVMFKYGPLYYHITSLKKAFSEGELLFVKGK